METIETGNQGYKAEVTVVTYCRNRKEIDDRSKFRILLVSTGHFHGVGLYLKKPIIEFDSLFT